MAADLTLRVGTFPTPIGPFTVIASDEGVVVTTTDDPDVVLDDLARRVGASARPAGRALARAGRELDAYFARRLRRFRTPVDLRLVSTPFALAVLEVTRSIPYGELWTYGDVAGHAGRPGAARAAGSALRRCPIELFVPCHRVVPAGPGLGRYGGDEDRRTTLLRLEGAI
jgi:methylated-DNA-[protein]-cysteine S-methyltransferase